MSLLDGWLTCPHCAHELTHAEGCVECASCGLVVYAHSSVTASAVPEDARGRALLARRAIEPDRHRWDCVGGFVHEGEHPLDGLRREVREETGLGFEPARFLGIWMGTYEGRHTLNLFWTGALSPGTPRPDDDVAELRWFGADELPRPAELAFDGLIASVLAAWRDQHA